MLNPKGKMFTLRGFLFCYKEGALHIPANGAWNRHEDHTTYEEAFTSAEEIVDEFYDMCEPNLQVCAVSH